MYMNPNTIPQREVVYLAALLHDIGKFWQRADDNGLHHSTILDKSVKELETLYCPVSQYGYTTHKHVIWTAQFIAKHESFFKQLLAGDYTKFFKAAVAHHKPDKSNLAQRLVQAADHYASGVDRTKEFGIRDAEAERKWDSFKNVRMVSIFEDLLQENASYTYELPIQALTLTRNSFPKKEQDRNGQKAYADLWEDFEKVFEKLKKNGTQNIRSFSENLLYLLQRFTTAVPSSTIHLPDVSLYDHLKSTGIFAYALHQYLEAHQRLDASFQIEAHEAPFLLVGGDLSGIQKYIYDIVSTDASKNLKGRSFYLQVIVENIVQRLLDELNLPSAAVVYASGGGFYLLAPTTPKIIQTLEQLRSELADELFERHQTSLFLGIDWVPVTHETIFKQQINEVWRVLMQKIGATKARKFQTQLVASPGKFFKPIEVGGKQLRDYITGEEFTEIENDAILTNKKGAVRFMDDEADKPVKETTYKQIQLGGKLKKTQFWVMVRQEADHHRNGETLSGFGYNNYFLTTESKVTYFDQALIRTFNLPDQDGLTIPGGNQNILGFTFYGGNNYPIDGNGEPLTFSDLAEANASGATKLGVLRMDVDNLGSIFIKGLGEQKRTFSRYSVLSRSLDFFFRGYLNTIWQEHFSTNTYIIYSGGDDLFVVGHWASVLEFAKKIKDEFKDWVCHNPHLTLSGGMVIVPPKFPIARAALLAEEAEKTAKNHQFKGKNGAKREKNAFTLLDTPLDWNAEFPIVENLKNELVELVTSNQLPRGVLQKLMNYAERAATQRQEDKNLSWKWHMAYDFSRAAQRAKGEAAKQFYDTLKNAAFTNIWDGRYLDEFTCYSFLDLLGIAARWAELETKSS